MTHEHAQLLLLDLAYGELSPDEAREVERHAAGCGSCAGQLEGLLATRRLAAQLADEPVPARGRAELLAAARRAVAPAPVRRRARSRAYALAASAAVVALAAGVALRLAGQRSPVPVRNDVTALHDLAPLEDVAPGAGPGTPAPQVERPPVSTPAPSAPPIMAPAAPERRRAPPAPESQPPLAPAGAPAQPLAVAPERAEASRAPQAARPAERPEARASFEPRSLVEETERRASAGELREEGRRLTCDGAPVERVALLDGARVVKLTVHADDGTVHEGWYDHGGRLRAVRRSTAGRPAMLSVPEDADTAEEGAWRPRTLPARAPDLTALSRCTW